MYRPPSSLIEYYNKMICDCENIMALGHDMIIMGDLNLNCFQNNKYDAHLASPATAYSLTHIFNL